MQRERKRKGSSVGWVVGWLGVGGILQVLGGGEISPGVVGVEQLSALQSASSPTPRVLKKKKNPTRSDIRLLRVKSELLISNIIGWNRIAGLRRLKHGAERLSDFLICSGHYFSLKTTNRPSSFRAPFTLMSPYTPNL